MNGEASIHLDDALIEQIPGAAFIVRVRATRIFPNCPRYIHKMKLVEYSTYAPRANHTPPVPEWKTFDEFSDVLPQRDRPKSKSD